MAGTGPLMAVAVEFNPHVQEMTGSTSRNTNNKIRCYRIAVKVMQPRKVCRLWREPMRKTQ